MWQAHVANLFVGSVQMKFRMSMFVDAFLGSGVPLGGDPVTSFQNVSLLDLRTATVLDNCRPMARDIVKVRVIATNCGERPIEIVPLCQGGKERDRESAENNAIILLPGESIQRSIFRSWEAPGEHRLNLAYEARCDGQPFARLAYPKITINVRPPEMHWIWFIRTAHTRGR